MLFHRRSRTAGYIHVLSQVTALEHHRHYNIEDSEHPYQARYYQSRAIHHLSRASLASLQDHQSISQLPKHLFLIRIQSLTLCRRSSLETPSSSTLHEQLREATNLDRFDSWLPSMSANRNRRLAKEIADIRKDTSSGITITNMQGTDDFADLTHVKGHFQGPPDTPYEGGRYEVDIRITSEYPFKPPEMRFITRIWHPNVSSQTVSLPSTTS